MIQEHYASMSLNVADTARLPFEVTRGNYQKRTQNIVDANERLFKKIIENEDNLSYKKLEELLTDEFVLTGTKGKIKTKPLLKVESMPNLGIGGVQTTIKETGVVTGYKIKIPGDEKGINKSFIGALMHEATHFFEMLFDPQILANETSLQLPNKDKRKIEKYYHKVLYTPEYFGFFNTLLAKIKLNSVLKNVNDKDKIKVLKELRNSLAMEILACSQGEKYEIRASSHGYKQVESADSDDFLFEDKIEFLNNEIARLINKIRKTNASKTESQN